jgi:hypothetical protein
LEAKFNQRPDSIFTIQNNQWLNAN